MDEAGHLLREVTSDEEHVSTSRFRNSRIAAAFAAALAVAALTCFGVAALAGEKKNIGTPNRSLAEIEYYKCSPTPLQGGQFVQS